jgi:hypothetical protein
MIASLIARLGAPLSTALALTCAGGLLWQTARIDGWPLIGGGLKADVARLQGQILANERRRAVRQAAMLAEQARRAEAANGQARMHELAKRSNDEHLRKVTESVHVQIGEAGDRNCVLPWGAVRLFDAAASGTDPDAVAALVAPGLPDDAPSDVTLSEAVTLLAANLARARANASQLSRLQRAVEPQADHVFHN